MDVEKVDALRVELERFASHLREALEPVFGSIAETLGQAAAAINEYMASISEAWRHTSTWEFFCAYAWACGARPEWVRILNHTKKARTRKKYQDRILRAYRNRDDVKGE